MAEPKNIDYRGIGEWVSICYPRDSSPAELTAGLSDGRETVGIPDGHLCGTNHSNISVVEITTDVGLEPETDGGWWAVLVPGEVPPTEEHPEQQFSPLERYYCLAQTHEQLAVGQIPSGRWFGHLNRLNGAVNAVAKLPAGPIAELSGSSWSIIGSSLGNDLNMMSAREPNGACYTTEPLELQAALKERAGFLRKITKLRRRLKTGRNGRTMRWARVRKRSKTSDLSNEAGATEEP